MSDPTMSNSTQILNGLIWEGLRTTPQNLMFWATMGLVLNALVLASIISLTIKYYELYSRSDHLAVRIAIGCGTMICISLLGLECAAVYELIHHAAIDYSSIVKSDTYMTISVIFFNGVFAVPAYIFYSWRSWKLFGRNKLFVIWSIPVCFTPLTLELTLIVKGYQCPEVSLENAMALNNYFNQINLWTKITGAGAMCTDGSLCIAMILGLYFSKQNFLNMEQSLFRRLTRLSFETMLPPSVLVLVTICSLSSTSGTASDFRRTALYCLPTMYFHCLLYCLVSRQSVRDLLADRLAADGVGVLSGDKANRAPTGGVYVSTTSYVHTGEDDLEAGKVSEHSAATDVIGLSPMTNDDGKRWM